MLLHVVFYCFILDLVLLVHLVMEYNSVTLVSFKFAFWQWSFSIYSAHCLRIEVRVLLVAH
jgi:hypothetical protein